MLGGSRVGQRDWLTVYEKLAPVRTMGTGDDLQQGGFARAVVADDRVHFPLTQLEVAVAERGDAAEVLGDSPGLQDDSGPSLALRSWAGHAGLRGASLAGQGLLSAGPSR